MTLLFNAKSTTNSSLHDRHGAARPRSPPSPPPAGNERTEVLLSNPKNHLEEFLHMTEKTTGTADTAATEPQQAQQTLVTSKKFFAQTYQLRWLVRGILIANQLAIVGGAKKSLKTSMMIDLAISLGSGRPFLGKFPVLQRVRVGLVSGENGEATIQETAHRICKARGIDPAKLAVHWGFRLPQLDEDEDLQRLATMISRRSLEVVIIDPLYLCLIGNSGVQASNLYEIGSLIARVSRTCLEAGATPILVHHAKKGSQQSSNGMELDDLTYAGAAEVARQWMLINRRAPFQSNSGRHRLRMTVGGSAGFAGCWDVDIDEGRTGDDFTGRTWKADVRPASANANSSPQRQDYSSSRF